MKISELISKYRLHINPPYHIGNFTVIFLTLFMLITLPLVTLSSKSIKKQNTVTQAATYYSVDQEEYNFLILLNNYRAQNGRGPLTAVSSLTNIADWMSGDMATYDYLSHTDSLGRDVFTRMNQMGYGYSTFRTEELAKVYQGGAQEALDTLKASPGHNTELINSNYTAVGINRRLHQASGFYYWALEMGGVVDSPVTYSIPGQILGRVWQDTDGDAVKDSDESYLKTSSSGCSSGIVNNGVSVTISGASSGTFYPSSCNPEPYYISNALLTVYTYTASVNVPAGWQVTGVYQSPLDPVWAVNPNKSATGILTSGLMKDIHFGVRPTPSEVLGRVWHDKDRDGVKDTIEPYIVSAGVNCPGANSPVEPQIVSVSATGAMNKISNLNFCNPDPHYALTNLNLGVYTIRVSPSAVWEITAALNAHSADPVWTINSDKSVTGSLTAGLSKDIWFGIFNTASDFDADGFTFAKEQYMGTNPNQKCSSTSAVNDESVDAYPPDFNDDQYVNLSDVVLMGSSYNKTSSQAGFNQRYDLNQDGWVNLADVISIGTYYNKPCQ